MGIFPQDRYRKASFIAFLILFGMTCIDPPYPRDFTLQHVLTVVAVGSLIFLHQRVQFSRLSYTFILAFLGLHLVGARYLYSFVPYDDWSIWLFGISINEMFGYERNHYDRLVHFFYGFLLVVPVWEVINRCLKIPGFWSYFIAFQFIVFSSTTYELMEWGVAVTLSPDSAEKYNGQQGDIWDPQRDMMLAMIGAIISITVTAVWEGIRSSKVR